MMPKRRTSDRLYLMLKLHGASHQMLVICTILTVFLFWNLSKPDNLIRQFLCVQKRLKLFYHTQQQLKMDRAMWSFYFGNPELIDRR